MIGALVFLGCPWRAYLRLAGGDLNAILGIAGPGRRASCIGVVFLKGGFSLGRSHPGPRRSGWIMPVLMVALLVLLLPRPFGPVVQQADAARSFSATPAPAPARRPC